MENNEKNKKDEKKDEKIKQKSLGRRLLNLSRIFDIKDVKISENNSTLK